MAIEVIRQIRKERNVYIGCEGLEIGLESEWAKIFVKRYLHIRHRDNN